MIYGVLEMENTIPELIFTIGGRQYWEEIRDTIKRITAEYGNENHNLRIKILETPCYSDKKIVYEANGVVRFEDRD